jgi:hypothetical protein
MTMPRHATSAHKTYPAKGQTAKRLASTWQTVYTDVEKNIDCNNSIQLFIIYVPSQ